MRKFFVFFLLLMSLGEVAFAAAGGAAMPWETPLQTIKDSLTGPVAGYIALIAIMICGAILIFGGDISGFARNLVNVVLACAVILGASSIITNLFPAAGAVIRIENWPGPQSKKGLLERGGVESGERP
jgi:type IV secretion system protein VirB2